MASARGNKAPARNVNAAPSTSSGRAAQSVPKPSVAGPSRPNTIGNGKFRSHPKPSAASVRNLLPSKINPSAVVTEPGSQPKLNATVIQSRGPTRERVVPLHATKKPKIINRKLIDWYDSYLSNYLTRCVEEKMAKFHQKIQTEYELKTILSTSQRPEILVKSYVNTIVTKLWDEMSRLDIIKGAFDNFIDFSGEEALVKIQTLLKRKFEVIYVKGGYTQDRAFYEVEMNKIVDDVRHHLTRNMDEKTVKGFLRVFYEKFTNLSSIEEETKKMIIECESDLVLELEELSLEISDKQRMAFEKTDRIAMLQNDEQQETKATENSERPSEN